MNIRIILSRKGEEDEYDPLKEEVTESNKE